MNTPLGHDRLAQEWTRRDASIGHTWDWTLCYPGDLDYPATKGTAS
jgi:hypothetical protein